MSIYRNIEIENVDLSKHRDRKCRSIETSRSKRIDSIRSHRDLGHFPVERAPVRGALAMFHNSDIAMRKCDKAKDPEPLSDSIGPRSRPPTFHHSSRAENTS
jgi:hypothetical protein